MLLQTHAKQLMNAAVSIVEYNSYVWIQDIVTSIAQTSTFSRESVLMAIQAVAADFTLLKDRLK